MLHFDHSQNPIVGKRGIFDCSSYGRSSGVRMHVEKVCSLEIVEKFDIEPAEAEKSTRTSGRPMVNI